MRFVVASLALFMLAACSGSTQNAVESSVPPGSCRSGPPEAGVWTPDRLKILKPCQHAAGTVLQVEAEPDGDHHIWFEVDSGYEFLLNKADRVAGKAALLGEITPACPLNTNPPDPETAAHCPPTSLPIPGPGDHIAVDGPWVYDVNHGWNEIHPVDSITISDAG